MNRIGIDIGGVLISKDTDSDSLFFSDDFLKAPEVTASIYTLQGILHSLGPENVYLVSKCSERVEAKTKDWLNHRYFFSELDFRPENVLFCRQRSDKARIASELALTLFVDDRYSVLQHMERLPNIKRLFLFNPHPNEMPKTAPDFVYIITHWFWLYAHISLFSTGAESTRPLFPLPPKWHFVSPDHSASLLDRFFTAPIGASFIPTPEFVIRAEDSAFLRIGESFFRMSFDWSSNRTISIEDFLEKGKPLDHDQMTKEILLEEETWFGWPQKDHPIWTSERNANGA